MKAFHSDPAAIKQKYLARVRAHHAADEIIHGTYWEHGKGCAVGCTVHSSKHSAYETELGIPRILARLEDGIFEGLTNCKALEWPEKFLAAITPGADLSKVGDIFLHWLLVDPVDGVIKFAKTDKSKKAIVAVGDLYARKIDGKTIDCKEWKTAASASSASAASASSASADASARPKARIRQSEKLLELLENCKP